MEAAVHGAPHRDRDRGSAARLAAADADKVAAEARGAVLNP